MAELSTIARPYAEALFAAVKNDSKGLQYWSELIQYLGQIVSQTDVQDALGDPRLSNEQRTTLLFDLAQQDLPEQAKNLIELIVVNNRTSAMANIAAQFELLRNQHEGTALAEITSAFELTEQQITELIQGLEKKFGLKLKAQVTVDPSLIGGVRVAVGDHVLDTSVQASLASLRDTLVA